MQNGEIIFTLREDTNKYLKFTKFEMLEVWTISDLERDFYRPNVVVSLRHYFNYSSKRNLLIIQSLR